MFVKRHFERIGHTLFAQAIHADGDIQYILELDRSGILASDVDPRPADGTRDIAPDNAQPQVAQEGMFGLLHELEKCREMGNARGVRFAELDPSLKMERGIHVPPAQLGPLQIS
jgi:hypothetical protein